MWRGGYVAIGYRPGCFSEIAGIPAITKLGDFPAKDFKKYSRWPRVTVGGYQGRLPAYHRASSKEIIYIEQVGKDGLCVMNEKKRV